MDGHRYYPSKEEAEYTAALAFALATAASWWAAKLGKATLKIPRMPAMECHGRRDHWLDLDPRSLRSWAMAPMAILLGLHPPDPLEAARVPSRGRVSDFLQDDHSLPAHCVYVGRGHHTHRLATTCWASPVVPGHDCSAEEWIARTFVRRSIGGKHCPACVTRPWCATALRQTFVRWIYWQGWCSRPRLPRRSLLLLAREGPTVPPKVLL